MSGATASFVGSCSRPADTDADEMGAPDVDVHRSAVVLEFSVCIDPSLILPRKVNVDTAQEFSTPSFKTNVRYSSRSTSVTAILMRSSLVRAFLMIVPP